MEGVGKILEYSSARDVPFGIRRDAARGLEGGGAEYIHPEIVFPTPVKEIALGSTSGIGFCDQLGELIQCHAGGTIIRWQSIKK